MADPKRDLKNDDPTATPTVAIGIVGAMLVFLIVVALQAFYYRAQNAEDKRKIVAEAPQELTQLRAQQQEELNTYRWVDIKKGVVAIPIDRAMEITVRELAQDQGAPPSGKKP